MNKFKCSMQKKKESLADNVNLGFKVGDFKGTQKSVILKIKKALDNKGIANEVVADGRCLEVTLDNANVIIQTVAEGGYGSHKSSSYVVLGKDSDNYRNQTDAYSIKDVMDYIQDANGRKSEATYNPDESKKSEATYNPDKVKADEWRLDYLSGVDDFYEGVKKYGFDLDDNGYWGSGKDGVYYRTIWLKNGKRMSGPNTNHIVKIGYDTNENTPFVAIDQYVLGNVQDLLTVIAYNFAPKTMESLAKKSEANIDDLKGMVVSDGTMRSEDLIPKFLNVLKTYGRDKYDAYVKENPEVLDLKGMDDETMGYVVDELFDKLDEIAPEGFYFAAHPDDGACYGFWEVDPNESKKPEACKGGKDDDKKGGKAAESKKSEGVSGTITMNIDYNTFMRLLDAAAFLDADEDYKDALWDYYSELGEIGGEALVFFDNLFQYTAWYDVDEMYDEIGERFQDESKSKEECIQDAIDDGDMTIYQYKDHYLVLN